MASSPDRKKPSSPASTALATRDWASLPPDILISVFLKLGPREIMMGAEHACTAWQRVAVDDPVLWRCVDMGMVSPCSPNGRAIVRVAVDRGAGECEAFSGLCDSKLLFYLVQRAPYLRSLHLKHLYAPNKVLNLVLKRLPLLEDLEISPTYVSTPEENLLQSICQDCPHLRKLRLNCCESFDYNNGNGMALERIHGEIILMQDLRSLELFHCDLTTQGLRAILDNCPLLETLHITGFLMGGEMDQMLRQKCAGVKDLTLPNKSVKIYTFHRHGPVRSRITEPWELHG
ncbi:hypothetical protein BAE44_0017571 [Dichanthelium oligosanthes]|uniref:F-box domain-containing protein n=1 Tax=Dichanthelium oligosanthes TaxID=888268 RepID=A0A1E5V8C1_9POAL|nr:hypothetical protein BAE44_0017571 [Dichanthelium oligosanthes]